jgi:hypothetical protein
VKFALMTTISFDRDPPGSQSPADAIVTSSLMNPVRAKDSSQMMTWLAQQLPTVCLGRRDETPTQWFGSDTAGGGWRLDVVTKHDDAFAARAARVRVRDLIAGSRWSHLTSLGFRVVNSYDEAEVGDGLPPTKTWPHRLGPPPR